MYRFREAQRTLREWGHEWRKVRPEQNYWVFPQKEGGLAHKLVRLGTGIWAIYSER